MNKIGLIIFILLTFSLISYADFETGNSLLEKLSHNIMETSEEPIDMALEYASAMGYTLGVFDVGDGALFESPEALHLSKFWTLQKSILRSIRNHVMRQGKSCCLKPSKKHFRKKRMRHKGKVSMNQDHEKKFNETKIRAQGDIQKAIDVLEDAVNRLYELRLINREDTALDLYISNIIEDEEYGIQKKRAELRDIKSQIASIIYTKKS